MPPGATTGPDGKFRICDLHSSQYQLTAIRWANGAATLYGTMLVTVAGEDIRDVRVVAQPGDTLAGQIVWSGPPPDKAIDSPIGVRLEPLNRPTLTGERLDAKSSIPGDFSFPSLLSDDYAVRVLNPPRELYVKDITYAGRSVMNEPMRPGSSIGNQELRVVIARDGGYLAVSVKGEDDKPVPDVNIFVMPAGARSEPELASVMTFGQADQNGAFRSDALAPGKYYVVAADLPNDTSPETIAALWRARIKAKEVEITSGTTAQVTVAPMTLN